MQELKFILLLITCCRLNVYCAQENNALVPQFYLNSKISSVDLPFKIGEKLQIEQMCSTVLPKKLSEKCLQINNYMFDTLACKAILYFKKNRLVNLTFIYEGKYTDSFLKSFSYSEKIIDQLSKQKQLLFNEKKYQRIINYSVNNITIQDIWR